MILLSLKKKLQKKKLLKDFKDGNISKKEFLAKMENEM